MQIDIKKVPRNREELIKEVVDLMKNEYFIKEICISIDIHISTYYR